MNRSIRSAKWLALVVIGVCALAVPAIAQECPELIGVLSETDCLRGVLSATYNDTGIGTVGEFMTSQNLYTASPGDPIVDVEPLGAGAGKEPAPWRSQTSRSSRWTTRS